MTDARAVIYPERYGPDGRLYDNLGRQLPSRPNWLTFLRAMPWLIRYFDRRVPDEATFLDVDEGGVEVQVIACPCGQEPRVPVATCVECDCERFYLATGAKVLCANSPHSPYHG